MYRTNHFACSSMVMSPKLPSETGSTVANSTLFSSLFSSLFSACPSSFVVRHGRKGGCAWRERARARVHATLLSPSPAAVAPPSVAQHSLTHACAAALCARCSLFPPSFRRSNRSLSNWCRLHRLASSIWRARIRPGYRGEKRGRTARRDGCGCGPMGGRTQTSAVDAMRCDGQAIDRFASLVRSSDGTPAAASAAGACCARMTANRLEPRCRCGGFSDSNAHGRSPPPFVAAARTCWLCLSRVQKACVPQVRPCRQEARAVRGEQDEINKPSITMRMRALARSPRADPHLTPPPCPARPLARTHAPPLSNNCSYTL